MSVKGPPGWIAPSARLWRMRLTQGAAPGLILVVIAGVATGIWAGAGAGAGAAAAVAVVVGFVLGVERRATWPGLTASGKRT
jgi:hypothetical protein